MIVSIAAQAVHGEDFLRQNKDDVLSALGLDVLGSPLDKLLIIAVLTSAAASTQTTILPTARTSLSMGAVKALPKIFARVHRRFQTPGLLDPADGRAVDHLVRRPDDSQRPTSSATRSPRSA